MLRQIQIEPGSVIVPNPGGQWGFAWDWESYVVALEGGWFSGKSFIGARKLVSLHIHNAFDDKGNPTYVPSACIAPTYGNAMDFCVPHIQDALDESNLTWKWIGGGNIASGRYSAPAITVYDLGTKRRPSVILVRSADSPEKITGWSVGAAWGDEPSRWKEDRLDPRRDALTQLFGRVRHQNANIIQILVTYTNEGDATRIYEEMHKGKTDRKVYVASTKENPTAKEFYQQQKENLTKDLADQYLEGKAVSLRGGRVYPSFDKNTNVDGRVKIVKNKNLDLHLSLDFNISPGMHGEIGQYFKEKDVLTAAKEIYAPRLSLRGLLKKFEEWIASQGGFHWRELVVFGDATGSSEWAGTGESCYQIIKATLKNIGFPYKLRVPSANPPVIDRVNAMDVACCDVGGRVHYKIHPSCERLIDDMQNMRRNKFGDIDDTDKKLSHASSAEGYRINILRPLRVHHRKIGGRINVV